MTPLEMSEDREFGLFFFFFLSGGTTSCKARRVTGSGGVSESGLTLYVQYYGDESAHVWDILIDSLS